LNLVALVNFMRLSLIKAARAALSSAAWQEIRVRSGRDDKFVARKLPIIQWMHPRSWLNKFVISTGAKRSGEICGLADQQSDADERAARLG
jgi:hypothetical protein